MSKPEQNEAQGLSGTKDSGSSRRRFIRNIAIGTAGAAIAMGNLDRLRGASRLLERLTNAHVDGFLDHVRSVTESPAAKQELQRIANLILAAVGNDPKSRETFTEMKAYLANPAAPFPESSTVKDIDMLMGAGYLRAIEGIQHTTRHVSAEDVKNRLQNPKAILHLFESGFLNQLYDKTKAETVSNPALANKLAYAGKEIKEIASNIIKQATTVPEAKLVPAGFLVGPCDCVIDDGNGNQYCVSWEVCVGIVVIFVAILLIVK
jgi:uncharacterized protein (DUF1501 family)